MHKNSLLGCVNVYKYTRVKTMTLGCITFEKVRWTHTGIKSVFEKVCESSYVHIQKSYNLGMERANFFSERTSEVS